MANTPKPVLLMNSVLAGLTFVGGGAALADVVPVKVLGVALLVLGGIQIAWSTYTQGQVTPNEKVAVVVPNLAKPSELVAGQAGPVAEGAAVDVTRAGPPYDLH